MQLRETKIGNLRRRFLLLDPQPGSLQRQRRQPPHRRLDCQLPTIGFLTPITFGGYSSSLKKNGGSSKIQNVLPFFQQVNGETHHQKRYLPIQLFGDRLDGSARRHRPNPYSAI